MLKEESLQRIIDVDEHYPDSPVVVKRVVATSPRVPALNNGFVNPLAPKAVASLSSSAGASSRIQTTASRASNTSAGGNFASSTSPRGSASPRQSASPRSTSPRSSSPRSPRSTSPRATLAASEIADLPENSLLLERPNPLLMSEASAAAVSGAAPAAADSKRASRIGLSADGKKFMPSNPLVSGVQGHRRVRSEAPFLGGSSFAGGKDGSKSLSHSPGLPDSLMASPLMSHERGSLSVAPVPAPGANNNNASALRSSSADAAPNAAKSGEAGKTLSSSAGKIPQLGSAATRSSPAANANVASPISPAPSASASSNASPAPVAVVSPLTASSSSVSNSSSSSIGGGRAGLTSSMTTAERLPLSGTPRSLSSSGTLGLFSPPSGGSSSSAERKGSGGLFSGVSGTQSARLTRKMSEPPMTDGMKARNEANALFKRKKYVEAFEYYNRAVLLEPSNSINFIYRAACLMKVHNYAVALLDCDSALAIDPVNALAYARKAKALWYLGRKDEAAVCYEKARSIDPKLPEVKKLKMKEMRFLRTQPVAVAAAPATTNGNSVANHASGAPRRNSGRQDLLTSGTKGASPDDRGGGAVPMPLRWKLFGTPLEELMAAQKPIYPELPVPEVVPYLMSRLVECNGLRSEGIFRLSIGSVELQNHLNALNAGRRDMETKDPNVYAVVLKHFFRNIPIPLCPSFESCMRVCEDYNLHDTSASLRRRKDLGPLLSCMSDSTINLMKKIWDTEMTPVGRSLVVYLFRLFSMLLLPENEKATKMSLENLALVFANGILRDPDPSAMSALVSQPNCQRFVVHLYTYVSEAFFLHDKEPFSFPPAEYFRVKANQQMNHQHHDSIETSESDDVYMRERN